MYHLVLTIAYTKCILTRFNLYIYTAYGFNTNIEQIKPSKPTYRSGFHNALCGGV